MILFAIDVAIIVIVAFCGWRGYKSGLIRGAFGVAALLVSLLVANVAAKTYSQEFTGMLTPFVGGIVETTLTTITEENISFDLPDASPNKAIEAADFKTAYNVLRQLGLPDVSAQNVAEKTTEDNDGSSYLPDLITEKLSSVLAYIAVFAVAFILLTIVFTVIGNLVGLMFSLPGLALVDSIAGTLLGLAKGLLIVFALTTVARYAGIISPALLDETKLLGYLVVNNPIAEIIGV